MKQPENALVEALINTDSEGLCILKIDGMMMVQINESFAKLLGSSTDYLKNKSLQDLQNTSLIKQHLISVVDQMHSQLKIKPLK
jgi:nitrogen-specific signal transduction histidine kinase